jgi:hypothetical protein
MNLPAVKLVTSWVDLPISEQFCSDLTISSWANYAIYRDAALSLIIHKDEDLVSMTTTADLLPIRAISLFGNANL